MMEQWSTGVLDYCQTLGKISGDAEDHLIREFFGPGTRFTLTCAL
jgi:hypothetical protein